jgi:hypothetical protein
VKVVYVIGPLRAATPYLVEQNIREAEAVALQVWRAGLSAVCVHSSTRFMHGAAPEEVFIEGVMEQLRRSDAVIVVGCYPTGSEGSNAEIQEAMRLGLPILYAWGDESYSGEIMRRLAQTPDGYRVEHKGPPGSARCPFWGVSEREHRLRGGGHG